LGRSTSDAAFSGKEQHKTGGGGLFFNEGKARGARLLDQREGLVAISEKGGEPCAEESRRKFLSRKGLEEGGGEGRKGRKVRRENRLVGPWKKDGDRDVQGAFRRTPRRVSDQRKGSFLFQIGRTRESSVASGIVGFVRTLEDTRRERAKKSERGGREVLSPEKPSSWRVDI